MTTINKYAAEYKLWVLACLGITRSLENVSRNLPPEVSDFGKDLKLKYDIQEILQLLREEIRDKGLDAISSTFLVDMYTRKIRSIVYGRTELTDPVNRFITFHHAFSFSRLETVLRNYFHSDREEGSFDIHWAIGSYFREHKQHVTIQYGDQYIPYTREDLCEIPADLRAWLNSATGIKN